MQKCIFVALMGVMRRWFNVTSRGTRLSFSRVDNVCHNKDERFKGLSVKKDGLVATGQP